jgi:hypothetical protein
VNILKFAEGEQVPSLFQVSIPLDASLFELLDGGTPFIVIYIPDMTLEETQKIRSSPIESGYIKEKYFWLGMIKVDDMIFELQFSPSEHFRKYSDFSINFFDDSKIVRVLGIDSSTSELNVLRCMTYPLKFSESLRSTFDGLTSLVGYDLVYEQFLEKQRQLSVEELWEKAKKSGAFVETFL